MAGCLYWGGQAVRGQRAQMLCCAALSASFCRQYTATAIQRSRPTPCTTAKPCYCKSCVTAFGGWPRASRAWQRAQTFCCVALPVLCCRKYPAAAGRRISEAGWLGQAVRGQQVQTFRCAALPRAVLLPLISRGRQRFGGFLRSRPAPRTAAKPCFCKSCVTAFGNCTPAPCAVCCKKGTEASSAIRAFGGRAPRCVRRCE